MDLCEKINYKGKDISYGRYLFNKCLPEDFPLIDETISAKKLKLILNNIALVYSSDVVMKTLDNIKELGFHLSTEQGYTLSIDQLYSEDLENIANSLDEEDMKGNMQIINNDKHVQELLNKLSFSDYIESGSRGSWEQAKQLVLCRGYVADANNKIRNNLIRSSLVSGLSEKEYFDSCWGARKGLLDTALTTAVAGYTTRQLVYSTNNIELDDSLEDCGTKEYIELKVKDEKFAKSLLWRFYLNSNNIEEYISMENYKTIVSKTIKLRSPVYCIGKNVCQKCYGNLYKILHSNQIGVIASQAISERMVQLVLRTFHTSGVAKSSDDLTDDNQDIISGLTMVNTLFHKPDTLKNVNTPADLVTKIQEIFGEYGSIHIVHFECIVSAMMWAGDKLWRTMENRINNPFEFCSILQIPTKNSWLIAASFANVKTKLLDGLVKDRTDESSSITTLFRL